MLGWPLVATVAAALLAVVIEIAVNVPTVVGYILLGLLVVAAGWLGIRALVWNTTNIVLTTSRVLERKGVFSRVGIEIRLDRVNELSYRQTLFERIVRTGSLEVEVGGETGVVIFGHMPQPAALQSLITEQIDAMRRAKAGMAPMPVPGAPAPAGVPTQGPPPQSVGDRLVQLEQLRQRGILTEAEFQTKKAELLQQL
jgi:uncharacterized membrane protein YdbT with pleckstrin-like domain